MLLCNRVEVGPVTSTSVKQAMILNSTDPEFQNNGPIPKKYTGEGDRISPPLAWSDVPAKAKSLVLIVEDADAVEEVVDANGRPTGEYRPHPDRPWVHWVLYNIPPSASGLPEGGARFQLPEGTREGVNGRGETGYFPPWPPDPNRHHYFHKLLALDLVLADLDRPSKEALLANLRQLRTPLGGGSSRSRIIAQAELVGTYLGS
jgi:Raf kinase inhibitor-like YbhB/YbcL family protein